jgi:hypothetical protein
VSTITENQVRQRAQDRIEAQARQELEAEAAEREQLHQAALAAEARLQHEVENEVGGILAGLRPLYQRRSELALGLAQITAEFWAVESALRTQLAAAAAPLGTLRLDSPGRQKLLGDVRVRAGLSRSHSNLQVRLGEGAGFDVAAVLLVLLANGYVAPGLVSLPSNSLSVSRQDRAR